MIQTSPNSMMFCHLWAEAVNTSVYVLNRTSKSKQESQSPYESFHKREVNINDLKGVFGERVFVHIPKEKRLKWDDKGEEAIFVGYEDTKGFRVYYEKRREVHTRRDVVFMEGKRIEEPKRDQKEVMEEVVLLDMSSEDEKIEQHEESEEEFHDTNTDEGEEQDKTPERTENIPERTENISERTEEGRNQNETEYQTTGIGSQNSATEDQNQGQRSKRKIIKPNKLEDYYLDSNVDEIIGYVDSDWGGCNDQAEFIALCSATSEACWLKDILFIFGFDIKIVIFEDNQSTIKMAQMATGNSRVKHLEIKLSFVKEKLDKNIIELRYINTSDQLADILTKALGGTLFRKLRDRLFSK
ncbi:unnamed protein product [Euphydryas editha]|uniref:Retroviral polymerase SH3-like domain-containing protein n=1 Tax=Euphydryas editha TaxID=104508 RepID=A0AAU9TRF7_EUPED|nr:unnamed protein product [Euphydryas editha]